MVGVLTKYWPGEHGQVMLIILTAVVLWGLGHQYLAWDVAVVAGLTVFCIGSWAIGAIPDYWAALVFMLLAVLTQVAPTEAVFAGFRSSTFWLLFSGMVIGAALNYTGLGKRLASLLARCMGQSYGSVLAATLGFGIALCFVMPSSMGRMVLLMPLVLALADHLGYEPGSNGYTGMSLAALVAVFFPGFTILPANVPNMILSGMSETLYGAELAYLDYLVLHLPVLGLLKALAALLLILWWFPADPPRQRADSLVTEPLSRQGRHMAVVMVVCLALWMSDGWHHIAPGWIGLGVALYCLFPGVGLVGKDTLNQKVQYGALFFVAAIIGLGAVMAEVGVGQLVMDAIADHVPLNSDQPVANVALLALVSSLVGMVTNLPGIPLILTPISQELANTSGLALATVLMTQVLAFSSVLLPYQAPPLLAAVQMGYVSLAVLSRLCLALFAITVVILLPLDLVWWYLLGRL